AVDAIRCCRIALDCRLAGPVEAVSAWTMKHPPRQMSDADALAGLQQFIARADEIAARQALKAS
ncbi:MAG TPA: hypothetical protein VF624_00910, partial [Tepidisphaeraceae bacterium]